MACSTPAASIKTTFPFGISSSPKPTRTNLLLSNNFGNGTAIEVRHANGAYFVRDTFWGTTLAAHRQQLAPEAFASLDTTVRQNGFDLNKYSTTAGLPPLAQLQKMPPRRLPI